MKRKSNLKKVLIAVVAVVLAAAVGLGVWHFAGQSGAEPVNVYPFSYLGMTEYWADSQESYGPVTTDQIQTIYLSDTQTITQVLVHEGDTVQKGDLLMTYDTTLSDLALERERLAVEKLKLRLSDAQAELKEIKNMKPMVIPSEDDTQEPEIDLGTVISGPYQISTQSAYDGSSEEKALICWLASGTAIDDSLFDAIRQAAEEYQAKNLPAETEPEGEVAGFFWTAPTDPTEDPTEEPTEEPTESPTEETTQPPTEEPTQEPTEPPTQPEEPTEPSVAPTEPATPSVTAEQFYVVFKMTESDRSKGQTTVWQGMEVTRNAATGSYRFTLFDASGVPDHTLAASDTPAATTPDIDYGSGYTAQQIAELRSQQEKVISDLQFQIRMAEAEYKIKQTEASTGEIRATIDGQVVSLLSQEEAQMTGQPMMKVSGGGGYYVEGSVSELEKDNLCIGQEVTINDWNTGMVYTGTIQSISDFPTSDSSWYGAGNPNVSYYPFTVFVDGSADLQAGWYVSVTFSSATAEHGIYLQNPFLRTEQGRSYVYVQGADGTLEQRYVTTGKTLWGSYTEILDGLSEEDLIAFPYGKNVRSGAQTKESDLSELYDY